MCVRHTSIGYTCCNDEPPERTLYRKEPNVTTHATGTFQLTGWDEKPYVEGDGVAKLTQAHVTQTFTGDIRGDGAVEWLMAYRSDGTANFVGMQRVDGQIGDREGTFVLQIAGTFDGKEAKGSWFVVPGSGSGHLQGLEGEGGMSAPMGPEATYTLDYSLA
ncbi:MAG: hypothetical protein JWL83_2531 [Actinomycetia bacterium]|nr:hypothetical protein [Actinomycetes bacterium]